jgi:hypothetical protein
VAPTLSRRYAPPAVRFVVDAVLPPRMDSDVLHDGHGTLADESDQHRVGADAVARDAAGGVGGVEEGRCVALTRAPILRVSSDTTTLWVSTPMSIRSRERTGPQSGASASLVLYL